MRRSHLFGETRKSQKLFIKAGFRIKIWIWDFQNTKNNTNTSTAIFIANNIKMNLRKQIVRVRSTWDCLRDLYSSRLKTLQKRICDLVWDNWEYHKKFRDNEPQGTSTSLHGTTRAVIPTVRTREPIDTFRSIFLRLHTKPYNES